MSRLNKREEVKKVICADCKKLDYLSARGTGKPNESRKAMSYKTDHNKQICSDCVNDRLKGTKLKNDKKI